MPHVSRKNGEISPSVEALIERYPYHVRTIAGSIAQMYVRDQMSLILDSPKEQEAVVLRLSKKTRPFRYVTPTAKKEHCRTLEQRRAVVELALRCISDIREL